MNDNKDCGKPERYHGIKSGDLFFSKPEGDIHFILSALNGWQEKNSIVIVNRNFQPIIMITDPYVITPGFSRSYWRKHE